MVDEGYVTEEDQFELQGRYSWQTSLFLTAAVEPTHLTAPIESEVVGTEFFQATH